MPLIVVCGPPCSGKSTRSRELAQALEAYVIDAQQNGGTYSKSGAALTRPSLLPDVRLVNDESIGQHKSLYSTPSGEKMARAAMLSATERELSQDTIVIVDGLNYIKGYRYQLYCVARAMGTPSCVIHVVVPPSQKSRTQPSTRTDINGNEVINGTMEQFLASQDNFSERELRTQATALSATGDGLFKRAPDAATLAIASKLQNTKVSSSDTSNGSALESKLTAFPDTGYGAATIASLMSRFEDPDARNRWDSPLFLITKEDKLPIQDIANAILHKAGPKPNLSTVVRPLTDSTYLHEVDRGTQAIVDSVLEQGMNGILGSLVVPGTSTHAIVNRPLTRMEVNKIRKQWLKVNKLRTEQNVERALSSFVGYFNSAI